MYTEQSLLSAIRHKDLKAFRFFYDKYAPSLNGHMLAYSMDSGCCNELLQQVFIKAWKDIDAYDPDKGRLYTWLLNMAMVIHKSGTGQNGYLPERVFMPQLY